MKIKLFLTLCFTFVLYSSQAQYTPIPDPNFEQALIDLGHDSGSIDGRVLTMNIRDIRHLIVSNKGINDLTGIEGFTNLESLNADSNNLVDLNLSNNKLLMYLYVNHNNLAELDLSNNRSLIDLRISNNQLKEIDLTQNQNLFQINLDHNRLKNLDISHCENLHGLQASYNVVLSEINLGHLQNLLLIAISDNALTELYVPDNPDLYHLYVENNNLQKIELNENNLEVIHIYANELTEFDTSKVPSVKRFHIHQNPLKEFDVVPLIAIEDLDISHSLQSDLDWSSLSSTLTHLSIQSNFFREINVEALTNLEYLDARSNNLNELDLESNTKLRRLSLGANNIRELNLNNNPELSIVGVSGNDLQYLSIQNGNNSNIISFAALVNKLDCIAVDDENAHYLSNWRIDAITSFSEDCDGKRNLTANEIALTPELKQLENSLLVYNLPLEEVKLDIYNLRGTLVHSSEVVSTGSIEIPLHSKGHDQLLIVHITTQKGNMSRKVLLR